MFSDKDDKGVQIRVPATANLMVDSDDRNEIAYPNPFDFQITKKNSILNGFFNRIGATEAVLEWNEPNGAQLHNLGDAQVLVSSSAGLFSTIIQNNSFSNVYYTAAGALDNLCAQLDIQFTPNTFAVSTVVGVPAVAASPGVTFVFSTCAYTNALGLASLPSFPASVPYTAADIVSPDLRPYRYIDIISEQLTYNQDLKDSSTAPFSKDVLCRWYFDYDAQAPKDKYGFPIDMGYEPFRLRRIFNPPKQIKWNPQQPLGNIGFQVYGSGCNAPIQSLQNNSQFLLTLQASEN